MLFYLNLIMLLQLSAQLLYGLILGVVQGISEWLPISSKTQVIVVSTYLLNLPFNVAYTFGLFMEIGTIIAAIIYFRKEVALLILFIIGRHNKENKSLFMYVLVSTIFTAIIAAPIYLVIASIQGKYNLGIPMLVIGLVLICDALLIRYSKSKHRQMKERRKLGTMGIKDFILVGIAQGIAALPGVSRSGITTSTLLLLNVESDEAFRLSFLNSIFATSGAVALTLIASRGSVSSVVGTIGMSGLVVAIIVSAVISIVLIKFLLQIAKHSKIVWFVPALGILAIFGGAIAGLTNIGS
jgi:undecaprenyl-diphosphatase